jgi:hypothetical protein
MSSDVLGAILRNYSDFVTSVECCPSQLVIDAALAILKVHLVSDES